MPYIIDLPKARAWRPIYGNWIFQTVACSTSVRLTLLVLIAWQGLNGWCAISSSPGGPDLYTCSYSNNVYDADAALMRQRSPTRFRLMASRYVEIVQATRGHNCSGAALVAFNGHMYTQAGLSDDPGLYQLVGAISSIIGTSLPNAFDATAFVVILSGILIGYAGCWRLYADRRARSVEAAVFVCLGLTQAWASDVYIFQSSPLIAGIPWIILYASRRDRLKLCISGTIMMFCCAWCSLVRSNTNVICFAFLFAVFLGRFPIRKILVPLLLIALACVPSMLFERKMIANRNAFLGSIGQTATGINSHPIWHSIYIGLGFIPNSEVPRYSDTVAIDKVHSIDPNAAYISSRYESILRREVVNIAMRKPMLLIANLAAKAVIVMLLGLAVLLPVIRVILGEKKDFWFDGAFALAIVLSAMNGILVVPRPRYLLTFLCLMSLYTSMKWCFHCRSSASERARARLWTPDCDPVSNAEGAHGEARNFAAGQQ